MNQSVLGDRDLEVVDAAPGTLVADQLGYEQRGERLGQGVGVASGPDRGDRAGAGEALAVLTKDANDRRGAPA